MKPIDYICGMNWVSQFDKEIHAQYASGVSMEAMCVNYGWRCIHRALVWAYTPQGGYVWNSRYTTMLNISKYANANENGWDMLNWVRNWRGSREGVGVWRGRWAEMNRAAVSEQKVMLR